MPNQAEVFEQLWLDVAPTSGQAHRKSDSSPIRGEQAKVRLCLPQVKPRNNVSGAGRASTSHLAVVDVKEELEVASERIQGQHSHGLPRAFDFYEG